MSAKGQSFTYLLYLQICQITTKTFTLCESIYFRNTKMYSCANNRKLLFCFSQYSVERQLYSSLIIISLFVNPACKKHSIIREPNGITFPYFPTSPIMTAHIFPFNAFTILDDVCIWRMHTDKVNTTILDKMQISSIPISSKYL